MEHEFDTYLLDQNEESKPQQPDYQLPESSKSKKAQLKAESESSFHCPKRRGRKPSQTAEEKRKKKIECDKNRRKRVKTDCERLKEIEPDYYRLKKKEAEYQKMEHKFELMMKELRATNEKEQQENKTLNSRVLELSADIEVLRNEVHQKQFQDLPNMDLSEMDFACASFDDLGEGFFKGVEEWEGLYHISTSTHRDEELFEGLGSSVFDSSMVESFIHQLNSNMKSTIDFSDFEGLEEELQTGGYNNFPSSLVPIANQIKQKYGDIASESTQSERSALTPRILFHAAMREMSSLTLAQVEQKKMITWNHAIKDALNIDFKVQFAKTHLEKIAYAYFGLAAQADNDDVIKKMNERILKLETELCDLKNKRDRKEVELNSEVRRQCIDAANYFEDQPLSRGLFG